MPIRPRPVPSPTDSNIPPVEPAARPLALDTAAAQLAGLMNSAMDAIVTVDEQQCIVLYNQAAEKIFGRPVQQMLGQSLSLLMPARFHGAHSVHMKAFGSTGVSTRRMGDGTVLYGLRANGEEFPMEASISQLQTPKGRLFTVILRDITPRVQAQRELQAFATESHALREGEKTRVARELHDELAQSLTAIKMDTIWVRDTLRDTARDCPADVQAKLNGMLAMLDSTVAATRRIAADLRPLLLDDLGLGAAVEWLAHNFTQRTGVACDLDVNDDVDLPEPYATAVFRIVQESLANVAKHARATRVSLHIVRETHRAILRIEDDGVGFDTTAPRKLHSLGLMGLRERAQLLQGSVNITSQPGRGTQIEINIPLQEAGGRS